jgi:flap endonuclease-1
MGIKSLMKLISDECPGAIAEKDIESYTGLKVAIDASMAIYQFLVSAGIGAG